MTDADMSMTYVMYFDKYLLETASIKRSIFIAFKTIKCVISFVNMLCAWSNKRNYKNFKALKFYSTTYIHLISLSSFLN